MSAGTRWRYDARLMATNPDLVAEFVEPDTDTADTEEETR